MSDEKRLAYLIQYHHSLSIQYASFKTHTQSAVDQLKKIEKEIESLLFEKVKNKPKVNQKTYVNDKENDERFMEICY